MGTEVAMIGYMDQEDWLDRQLREAAPYIDDAGFTARVLQRLPAPWRQREWPRILVLLTITILASALAYVLGGGKFVGASIMQITALPILWIFLMALGTGILVTAGSLFVAIRTRELQS
jgi:hypothetical protein